MGSGAETLEPRQDHVPTFSPPNPATLDCIKIGARWCARNAANAMDVWAKMIGTTVLFCWATAAAPTSSRSFWSDVSYQFKPVAGGHGCVNAADDPRIDPYGIICSLQRGYSYKSVREPRLHVHRTWAWGISPPYFVSNRRLKGGGWRVARIGWRYDRNWHGYIGPSGAWKIVAEPLMFY